jgi:hypothetical protein
MDTGYCLGEENKEKMRAVPVFGMKSHIFSLFLINQYSVNNRYDFFAKKLDALIYNKFL